MVCCCGNTTCCCYEKCFCSPTLCLCAECYSTRLNLKCSLILDEETFANLCPETTLKHSQSISELKVLTDEKKKEHLSLQDTRHESDSTNFYDSSNNVQSLKRIRKFSNKILKIIDGHGLGDFGYKMPDLNIKEMINIPPRSTLTDTIERKVNDHLTNEFFKLCFDGRDRIESQKSSSKHEVESVAKRKKVESTSSKNGSQFEQRDELIGYSRENEALNFEKNRPVGASELSRFNSNSKSPEPEASSWKSNLENVKVSCSSRKNFLPSSSYLDPISEIEKMTANTLLSLRGPFVEHNIRNSMLDHSCFKDVKTNRNSIVDNADVKNERNSSLNNASLPDVKEKKKSNLDDVFHTVVKNDPTSMLEHPGLKDVRSYQNSTLHHATLIDVKNERNLKSKNGYFTDLKDDFPSGDETGYESDYLSPENEFQDFKKPVNPKKRYSEVVNGNHATDFPSEVNLTKNDQMVKYAKKSASLPFGESVKASKKETFSELDNFDDDVSFYSTEPKSGNNQLNSLPTLNHLNLINEMCDRPQIGLIRNLPIYPPPVMVLPHKSFPDYPNYNFKRTDFAETSGFHERQRSFYKAPDYSKPGCSKDDVYMNSYR